MEKQAKIYYFTLTDGMVKKEKLRWFSEHCLEDISFEVIHPDKDNNWLNLADNDFEELIPVANKETKLAKSKKDEKAIFQLFSLGIATNRDEWVYDFAKLNLINKIKFFCSFYEGEKIRWNKSNKKTPLNDFVDRTIKWTSELENHLKKDSELEFNRKCLVNSIYRPYIKLNLYYDRIIIHRLYQQDKFFPISKNFENKQICFSGISSHKSFHCLVTRYVSGLDFLEKTQCLPFYRYDADGNRYDNITDWGLQQFTAHYQKKITKHDIFHYVYAVLHNPEYRKKYEINLKREFPRIPFYENFQQWTAWGKTLMDLHINYETVKPYPLKIHETSQKETPKPKLRAIPDKGEIILDENTTISGIPATAWEYKLGNRSALHWILDQYKEKKPKDKTIAEKFNTYKFADYKEQVIDLLKRVCTVSVKTIEIIKEME